MRKNISALLLTATVLSTGLAGCTSVGSGRQAASVSSVGPQATSQVEKALADRQFPKALALAEGLVAASSQNADHRALLGRAYLANGRYYSARSAFADAMTLGNHDVRTIISLALADTAIGNGADAHALLSANIDHLPAEDYGLAMALTGDAEEGVRALLEASRYPGATARTRQNLAFALAIGGAWGQARLIAGQDLKAKDAEKRIGQWSQVLVQHDPGQRVAVMTGVLPRSDDAGLPVHLALNSQPVQQAIAAPAIQIEQPAHIEHTELPTDVVAFAAPVVPMKPADQVQLLPLVDVAAVEEPAPSLASVIEDIQPLSEAPQVALLASQQVSHPAEPQSLSLTASTVEAPSLVASPEVLKQALAPVPFAPVPLASVSKWVVQIGAYNNSAVARERGQGLARSQAGMSKYQQVYSEITLNGRVFHRLSVKGFADRAAANATCNDLTRRGQACFVRSETSGEARMARAETSPRNSAKPVLNREYAAR